MRKSILKKIMNHIVYAVTEKPKHYVHIDKPKSLQDYRQVQYNKWSKRYGVYSGSYLPDDESKLLKKGWADETVANHMGGGNTLFRRKSSGQWVRNDHDATAPKHILKDYPNATPKPWHWYSCSGGRTLDCQYVRKHKRTDAYFDKYGNPCGDREDRHHIGIWGRDDWK